MSYFIPSDFGPPYGVDFIPNLQYIYDITQAVNGVVTFTADHNFFLNQWISFRVPSSNGMIQLNNKKALVIALTSNTVTINVSTLGFYPFIMGTNNQYPCCAVPAGSGIKEGTTSTILDDAFDAVPLI